MTGIVTCRDTQDQYDPTILSTLSQLRSLTLTVNHTLTKYAADNFVDEPLFPLLNIP